MHTSAILATLAALCGLAAPALAQPTPTPSFNLFLPITGQPGIFTATVRDISDDGSTVLGNYTQGGNEQTGFGFLYTTTGGLLSISIPGTGGAGAPSAISGDGTLSVGRGGFRAFTYSPATDFVPLPSPASSLADAANGISRTGAWIVGTAAIGTPNNFATGIVRWNAQRVPEVLPFPPLNPAGSQHQGIGVSENGTRVVGNSSFPQQGGATQRRAHGWREGVGTDFLPVFSTQNVESQVRDITDDGRYAVGTAALSDSGPFVATRWDLDTNTIQSLGTLPNSAAVAQSVSDDGNVVVGNAVAGFDSLAFAWTPSTGMITLEDYLRSNGVPLPLNIVELDDVVVSGDGLSFAGEIGWQLPSGQVIGGEFIARIPTPGTACVVLAGLVYGLRRRR